MTTASHKLSRENRELMEENDRLIGKIEKLVEIFGNNLEQESSTGVQSNTTTTVSALNTGAGNARLYLLSRRALRKKDETEQEGEKGQLKGRMIHIGVDFTKNHTIDRSLSDIRYTPSKEEAPADTPESTSQPAQPTKTAAAGSKKNSLRGGESLPAKDKEAKEPSRISSRRNSETKDNSSLNQIQKNKDQLKKELRDLDAEIKSLQK